MSLSIRDAARAHPHGPALVDGAGTLTWGDLDGLVLHRTKAGGFEAGRPQVFDAHASRSAIVELLAAWASRAIAVPLHPRWTEAERAEVEGHARGLHDERLAALVRTSGSSGSPRLAALSQHAIQRSAHASALRLGWEEDDRWLLALPFAHVGGLSVIARCLLARRAVVLADDPLAAIEAGACTLASLVPTQLQRLVQRNIRAPASIRAVLVGGASCPPALTVAARRLGWPVKLTYGLTETCAQFATQRPGDPDDTVGAPLEGGEARLDGGVLEVRSPSLLSGFVQQGRVIPAIGEEGWYRTGDLATLEGGRLRILGRADDVIVTGGEKVHPSDVEAALTARLGVPTHVVGVADPEWGEAVAAVVLHCNIERAVEAIDDLPLAPWARPRLLACVEAVPETSTGKLDRRAIRGWPRSRFTAVRAR